MALARVGLNGFQSQVLMLRSACTDTVWTPVGTGTTFHRRQKKHTAATVTGAADVTGFDKEHLGKKTVLENMSFYPQMGGRDVRMMLDYFFVGYHGTLDVHQVSRIIKF